MNVPRIFIDGEAGTTGLQICSLLQDRRDLEVLRIDPDKRKDPIERKRLLNSADLVVLCLPDEGALESVSLIENPAVRVLDASTAHRTHPDWVYGFPELSSEQPGRIRSARLVANPGCYATGAIALLRPLVDAGILPEDYPLVIHAVEGYSGGGKNLIDAFESSGPDRITDPYRLYSLELSHKHLPEIQMHAGLMTAPIFWPAVGAFYQGMLVQIPLHLDRLIGQPGPEGIRDVLSAHYAQQKFVKVLPAPQGAPGSLAPEALNGTNNLEIFVFGNEKAGHCLLVARADNLGKGASGAAVQNISLMLKLDEPG